MNYFPLCHCIIIKLDSKLSRRIFATIFVQERVQVCYSLLKYFLFCIFRLTLPAQIMSCGPWEQISSTNMHIHGSGKWTSLFIMSIKLVLFRIIINALFNFWMNLIILFLYRIFYPFNLPFLGLLRFNK